MLDELSPIEFFMPVLAAAICTWLEGWVRSRHRLFRIVRWCFCGAPLGVGNPEKFQGSPNGADFHFAWKLVICTWIIVFGGNALFAYQAGRFWPDNYDHTRWFLEDYVNISNYLLL